jgi:hypothetical protein
VTEYVTDRNGRRMKKPSGRPRVAWETRFEKYVDRDGPLPEHRTDLGPCYVWTGGLDPDGYPIFSANTAGKTSVRAHKWIYQHEVGPVPEGLELDHLCRTRNCVRSSHLEPVTTKENWARSRPWRILTRDSRGVFIKKAR